MRLICCLSALPLYAGTGLAADSSGVVFSHALHLTKTKATCLTCHAPVIASTAATDNNLPTEATCRTCHDGQQAQNTCDTCYPGARIPMAIYGFAERNRTVIFDHQKHLAVGAIAEIIKTGMQAEGYRKDRQAEWCLIDTDNVCTACHRGMDKMEHLTATALPAMEDCLLCHQSAEPDENCKFCHTPDHQFKPVSHTFNFIDEHQATTDFIAGRCFVCHSENYCAKCH